MSGTEDFELSQSAHPLMGTVIHNRASHATNESTSASDDRQITATGKYNLDAQLQNMGLGNDSDNYSDEDFYSDEDGGGTKLGMVRAAAQDESDREDDDFAFDETVKKGELNQVLDIYERYLERNEEDSSGNFDDYKPTESFKEGQARVQQAYGDDTELYKTLNPKHSQAQIKPASERHQESKDYIEQRMGKDLFAKLYEMLEIEIQEGTDPSQRQSLINEIVQGKPELI